MVAAIITAHIYLNEVLISTS